MTSTHENQYIDIRFVMAEKKESIAESKLNSLHHLHPFVTRVAPSAVFNSDSQHAYSCVIAPHPLPLPVGRGEGGRSYQTVQPPST